MYQTNCKCWAGRAQKKIFLDLDYTEIRGFGGGRKSAFEEYADLDELFLKCIDADIAGDPMDEKVRWVKLTRAEICAKIVEFGIKVSRNIVRKLLKKHGFVKRKMQRSISGGVNKDRNEQFENIEKYKAEFLKSENPIISIDTKKKELLGELFRAGSVYCKDQCRIAFMQHDNLPQLNDFEQQDTCLLIAQNGQEIYLLQPDKTIQTQDKLNFIRLINDVLDKDQIEITIDIIILVEKLKSLSQIRFTKISKTLMLNVRDQVIKVNDHDFVHLSTGKIVPHGIYDIKQNKAYINIGNSYETAEFVCDSIQNWWNSYGKTDYPNATEILILSDAGGANSYRHHIFKIELQDLTNAINMPIQIAHYPPYASKWNPIEHRVFPHVTKALDGIVLKTEEQVAEIISTTKTKSGLSVIASVIKKAYTKGKEWTGDVLEKVQIQRETSLGQFNYKITPQTEEVLLKC